MLQLRVQHPLAFYNVFETLNLDRACIVLEEYWRKQRAQILQLAREKKDEQIRQRLEKRLEKKSTDVSNKQK